MFKVNVNGEDVSLDHEGEQVALLKVLETLHVDQSTRGVAVAVNDEVVPKSVWSDTMLAQQDRVEVIRATQGG
mgnify:FL=1